MKLQNKFCSKGATKRLSFAFCLVFALSIIFFQFKTVFAIQPIGLPPFISGFYTVFTDAENKTYCLASDSAFKISPTFTFFRETNDLIHLWVYTTDGWAKQPDFGAGSFKKPYTFLGGNFVIEDSVTKLPIYVGTDVLKPKAILSFVSPVMGFRDIQPVWYFDVQYKFPPNTPKQQLNITLGSSSVLPQSDCIVLSDVYNPVTGIGLKRFKWVNVTIGGHVFVADSPDYRVTINIERVAGVVDVDGDGIDDRTGTPVTPTLPSQSNDSTSGIDGIKGLTSFISSMKEFSTQLFSFMPNEVRVIMVFVITVMGFIAIKRFIL